MLIKASLLDAYELPPGACRAAPRLTRLMMVPSAPKCWMKDWIGMRLPLTFVSCLLFFLDHFHLNQVLNLPAEYRDRTLARIDLRFSGDGYLFDNSAMIFDGVLGCYIS